MSGEFREEPATPQTLTDLEMMQSVGRWPMGTILPLKKPGLPKSNEDYAVLRYFTVTDNFGLYRGVLIYDVEAINNGTPEMFESKELYKITDEGWLVD